MTVGCLLPLKSVLGADVSRLGGLLGRLGGGGTSNGVLARRSGGGGGGRELALLEVGSDVDELGREHFEGGCFRGFVRKKW